MLYNPSMANFKSREYHPAFEEYCETIFELDEDDLEVIQARIAERMKISRPAVSSMIRRMQDQGLLEKKPQIRLTRDGLDLAEQVVRRHRLAERFLTDILGLAWAEAHDEAGKWEHIISPQVEESMTRLLDNPTTCPHGNPIPGAGYSPPDIILPLDKIPAGKAFTVIRIPEELEFANGMLKYLEDASVIPGHIGIIDSIPEAGSEDDTIIRIAGGVVSLDFYAASRVLVTPLPIESQTYESLQKV